MIQTDPETGEGLSLLGECNARHNVGACPAGHMHGVQMSMKVYQRSASVIDDDGRAVVFTDERTPPEEP
jgi:hypothetical protein